MAQEENISENIEKELDELGKDLKNLRVRAKNSADKFEKEYKHILNETSAGKKEYKILRAIYIVAAICAILAITIGFITDMLSF